MSTALTLQIRSISSDSTEQIGRQIGANLKGGEIIELISDLGGGKTTLVRGIASGAGSSDDVASPTFTVSRVYNTQKFSIHHFDFYRLLEPGIIAHELTELQSDTQAVMIIEWGDIVAGVLPEERLKIAIAHAEVDNSRDITITVPSDYTYLVDGVQL